MTKPRIIPWKPQTFDWSGAREAWGVIGAELVAEAIESTPGHRPWGWWAFEATEPRRLLPGMPDLALTDRLHFGVPLFYRPHSCPEGIRREEDLYESQLAYLGRLNLLAPGERERIEVAE